MFNAPLSETRARDLIRRLNLPEQALVVDYGCGDGAFLRLMAEEAITGIGVDNNPQLIEKARQSAENSGLSARLHFVQSDAQAFQEALAPLDAVICIGAEFVFGGYAGLLAHAHRLLKPKGKLLVGTIYWKQAPPADYLSLMGGENPYFDLLTTVSMAREAGFLALDIQRSQEDEWDSFESQHSQKRLLNALENGDNALLERAWQWQAGYLRWGMATMGFCWLLLHKTA